MKAIFHTMMIWLMLLAIPVQGFAAASMMLCAPVAARADVHTSAGPHDHAAMLAAQASNTPDQPTIPGQHVAGKCGVCAACCMGIVMMTSTLPVLPVFDFVSQHHAADTTFLPSVIPDHPERPPQLSLA